MDVRVASGLPSDFMWQCPVGLVLVERKTWPDFVASVTGSGGADAGNRLVGQLIEAPKSAAVRVLLLEGALPAYVSSGGRVYPAEDIDDMSVSLQWVFGVILIHSHNNAHTPIRLAKFYSYTQKEEHNSLLRPVPPVPEEKIYMNPEFRKKIAAMMCVPQLGEKGALIVAQSASSPKVAVNLTQDELLQIPGIGKTRAANWVKFWESW